VNVTRTPDVFVPAPRHLPAGFDVTDLGAMRAVTDELLARPVATPGDLERWILDVSELERALWAGSTRRRIAMTRDTADASLRAAHLAYERDVTPEWQRLSDRLRRRYLGFEAREGLGGRFRMLDRAWETSVALFREENVELEAHDTELRTRYAEVLGKRTVDLDGESLTLPQCAARLEEPDRDTRASAYGAMAAARAKDAPEIDGLLDKMLGLRGRIARNAGFDDYRGYAFEARLRFDYDADDCLRFHDAVEEVVVPVVRERMARRRRRLQVETIRPYDLRVDPDARAPLCPFEDEAGFVELGRALFRAVDPVFEEEFSILVRNGLLDLMSRPGKAQGGYNSFVSDIRLPFIFANAVGSHRDVRTLLHEGGHAFHSLLTRDEPVPRLSHAPIEFCEVASMAMELFGLERYDTVFSKEDARAARASLLEQRLWMLPWIAAVDAFQHWLYTNPGHAPEERNARWVALRNRFAPYLDWRGLEDACANEWHQQLHIFRHPFYYIEYAIAQVGALQLWRRFRDDPKTAVADYRRALALGGTRPLPELFDAAGARFSMGADVLREVTEDVVAQLATT